MKAVNRIGTSQSKKPGRTKSIQWLYNYDDGAIGDDNDSDDGSDGDDDKKATTTKQQQQRQTKTKKNITLYLRSNGQSDIPRNEGFFPARKKEKDDRSKPMKRTKKKIFQKKATNLQLELCVKQTHLGTIFFPLDTAGTHDL